MNVIKGLEYHDIIKNIFGDVKGLNVSEQLQVNCPKCQERENLSRPDGKFNLEINTAKKVFKCWKCNDPIFSGSLNKLIKLYGSKIDYELYKSLSNYFDYTKEEDNEDDDINIYEKILLNDIIYFSDMDINNPLHLEPYNYLVLNRKIEREIILKYKLGFCLKGKYANRIIIPSFDVNGNINYFTARSYKQTKNHNKYLNPKINKNNIIFNEGFINWNYTVFLVEGVFDMLSLPINTIPLLGKIISYTLISKLKEKLPNVIIILDPDAYKDAINIFFTLNNIYVGNEDKINFIKLEGNDDLNDLLIKGKNNIIEMLYKIKKIDIDDLLYYNK